MANKILVVGMPRSGTSWIMQTLFHLDIPLFGIPNPPNRDKTMQPEDKPFWEHPDTLSGDLTCLGDSYCAVKVHLRKAIENIKLDPSDKVILCKRAINIIAQAQEDWKLASNYNRNIKVCTQWYDRFNKWVDNIPNLEVSIDFAIKNESGSILAIKNFVGSEKDITDAVNNIVRTI